MALLDPKSYSIGKKKYVVDFRGGMASSPPQEDINDNQSPYIRNCAYDRKHCLHKVWGTSELLTVSSSMYNRFISGSPYNAYNYVTPDGQSKLIMQGHANSSHSLYSDTNMSLFALDKQSSYPASVHPTRILGTDAELTDKRKCDFATYKGRMYVTNGADTLKYWAGNGTEWRDYHTDKPERFRYIAAHGSRLWLASSGANPSRLIWTDLEHCNFYHYYALDANRADFTSADDYSPIMWICEFEDALLIFKINSIYIFHGNPDYTMKWDCLCHGIGTINGWSVQVFNREVFFAWKDGIYIYAPHGLSVRDDRAIEVAPNIYRVTKPIDDFWRDNITLPDPYQTEQKVWSGYADFCRKLSYDGGSTLIAKGDTITGADSATTALVVYVDGDVTSGDLYICSMNTEEAFVDNEILNVGGVGYAVANGTDSGWTSSNGNTRVCIASCTDNPDVMIFEVMIGATKIESEETTTGANWVNLRGGENQKGSIFFSQSLTTDTTDVSIPSSVDLYLTNNGTLTTSQYLKVYITGDSSGKPDFNTIYAEGKFLLDAVTTAAWHNIPFDYWDYPLAMNRTAGAKLYIAVVPYGDTAALYAKWHYATGDPYRTGAGYSVVNSDTETPASQTDCDYTFKLNAGTFYEDGVITTTSYHAVPTSGTFDHWESVYVSIDDTGTRNSKLVYLGYEVSADGSFTGTWTETTNGGEITGTGTYLKLLIVFRRNTQVTLAQQDSFSLRSVRVTYSTQTLDNQLVSSVIKDGNYIFSVKAIADPEYVAV